MWVLYYAERKTPLRRNQTAPVMPRLGTTATQRRLSQRGCVLASAWETTVFPLRPWPTLSSPVNHTMSFPSGAPSSSSHPGSVLDVALTEYRKNTGKDLLSHPLATELQRCDSIDGILAILQRQTNTFEQRRDSNQGLMKWIGPSVHILCSFSGTLGDGLGVVSLRNPFCV